MRNGAVPEEKLSLRIRAPVASDEAFIFRTWLDSMRVTGPMVKQVRDRVFFPHMHRKIEHLFVRGARCYVAGPEDDTTVIYGYLVYDPTLHDDRHTLHFLYVKSTWRRLGVATALLASTHLDPNNAYFTCWTSSELSLNAKREAARRGIEINWRSLREVKAEMAAEREANGTGDGDTRTLLKKWPGALYNPFLLEP